MSAIAFTSCKDNNRTVDDEQIELDANRDTELMGNDEVYEDDMNSVSYRIQENRDLSVFAENMNRNQITMPSRVSSQGAVPDQDQAGTTTEQGQMGNTGNSNLDSPQADQARLGQAQTEGSYTIFAPSNDAYNELSETERNAMMATQNRESNTASINYLMVEERLTEENLREQIQNANGTYTIRTMQGEDIMATLENDEIVLKDGTGNQARITQTDSEASDGIVHVIDEVLRPQDPTRNEAVTSMNRNDSGLETDMERSTNTTGARSQ